MPNNTPIRCGYCSAANPDKRCACGETYYCSVEHQRLHWKDHKPICERLRSSKASCTSTTSKSSYKTPPNSIPVNRPYCPDETPGTAQYFVYFDHYGFGSIPDAGSEDDRQQTEYRFTKVMTLALGSGGMYGTSQVQWLKGFLAAKAYATDLIAGVDAMLQEASQMNPTELAMEAVEILNVGHLQKAAHLVVYDMILGAAVQNFPACQMEAIAVLSNELGLDDQSLEQLKQQVLEETTLKRKRLSLLFPNGHPCLDSQYKDNHDPDASNHPRNN